SGLIPRMQGWELRDVWPQSVRDYLTQPNAAGETGYERAEKLMKKGKTLGPYATQVLDLLSSQLSPDFDVIDLPRSFHQPDIDEAGELQNVLRRSNGAFSTADLLLDSLGFSGSVGRQNLRINLHRLATRIETSQQEATAVVCQDLVGRIERRYRGRHIVLCCGSLESPKLAIKSGLTDPNLKMGKGLTDHPSHRYKMLHELKPDNVGYEWLSDPLGHAKVLIRHTGATSLDHAYNIELLINAHYWDTRHADEDLWKRVVAGQKSYVEIKFIFDSLLNDQNSITPLGEGVKPEVRVAKNFPPEHYKQELVDVRNRVLGGLGITGLTSYWDDGEWEYGVDGSVHHAGGTLRMSADGSGVLDENLKFLAYDNLYCCDVSVYPSIPAANPSLTLAALAQRLSDTLAAKLGLP
ncbi:MAG: GMC oxidoreductase, partial [Planctomycetota bacterium]